MHSSRAGLPAVTINDDQIRRVAGVISGTLPFDTPAGDTAAAGLLTTLPFDTPAGDTAASGLLRTLPSDGAVTQAQPIPMRPFSFTGEVYPPVGHPAALDYFWSATLQQFGFWETRNGRYCGPMLAQIDGQVRKGSDYLWRAWARKLNSDPQWYEPEFQAVLSADELSRVLRADDGSMPMPAFDLHLQAARSYGQDMLRLNSSPQRILKTANGSTAPLSTFLESMSQIVAYKEDPLRKKSALLALILSQRPEGFLRVGDDEQMPPIIDYHLMRSCLRMGLIEVQDERLGLALEGRDLVQPEDEWAVRSVAYEAVLGLVQVSGLSMGAVDWFLFSARKRCPEMTEPECSICPVDPVCSHYTHLFQPVLRTTYY